MYSIKVATPEDFESSRETWNALAASMSYPSVFCTWEWVHTWARHFASVDDLFLLFVYDDSELKGILPLFFERARLRKNGFFGAVLTYCGATHLYPDHLDIICASTDAERCLDAVFDFLAHGDSEWDVLRLPYVAEDSTLMTWLNDDRKPLLTDFLRTSAAPYLPISGTFEDYLKGFSKKKRYNILTARRKLLEEHGVDYVSCEADVPVECLEVVLSLHERRATQRNLESSFARPEVFQFHVDLLRAVHDEERAWIRFLRKDSKAIAAFYGFTFGGTLFFYQGGYDPAWERLSPGAVLLCEAIREAFSKGCHEFNFLQGDEEYKHRWTKVQRGLFELVLYRRSLAGLASRAMVRSKSAARRLLRRV